VFLHPVGFVGYVVHSGVFGSCSVDVLFFMLRWAQCDFHKKRARTSYAELVCLHLVVYAGHIVHSGASGARNVDALFFLLR
jgi:hypothetical protein